MRREHLVEGCSRTKTRSASLSTSYDGLPIVGDLRGAGYFWALELVADKD